MKPVLKGIAMLMAVTLLSCGKGSDTNDIQLSNMKLEEKPEEGNTKESMFPVADSTAGQTNSSDITLKSGNPSNADWDKKIIKTAHVTLELEDFRAFNSTIHNSIQRYAAYIASEQLNQSDAKIENILTIKVPVSRFEELMNALPAEGVKVLEKTINTEDVTGQIVDTKARIEARKQVREQYLGLLKKAKSMKEVLEVQKEVNAIQEDIEAGSGRAALLSHETAFSTVNLTYFQYLSTTGGKDNSSPTFLAKSKDAFDNGAAIVEGLLLIIVTFWPLFLVTVIVVLFYKKYFFKTVKLAKKE